MLPKEYGPHGLNAFNLQFDYGVIVFRRGGDAWLTAGGAAVTIPAPVTLAPPGFVETIVNRFQPPATLTAVGYGTGEAHNKPGEGGNKGGAVNDPSKLGVRWQTSLTRPSATWARTPTCCSPRRTRPAATRAPAAAIPAARCSTASPERQVGVTSSGDSICRATSIIARTDGAEATAFLGCVQTAPTPAAVETCGCTEVTSKGLCPPAP